MKKKNVTLKKLKLQRNKVSNLSNLKGGIWGTASCGTTCLAVNGTVNPYDVKETIRLLSGVEGAADCNYSHECSDICPSHVYYATCAYGDDMNGGYDNGQG